GVVTGLAAGGVLFVGTMAAGGAAEGISGCLAAAFLCRISLANGGKWVGGAILGGVGGEGIPEPPGCPANSFTAETRVLMADGSAKPINEIKVGDKIANAVPGTSAGTRDQAHTVTAIHITRTDHDYTDVVIANPQGPQAIQGTAHHLYWD